MHKTVDKIFHVSDIHVRMTQRHDEYVEVFDRLYKYIVEHRTDNSLIVLTGDIAHSKIEMSPEMTSIITNFLRQCADLCPTILIAGNHDFNGLNSKRLDVLSPIWDALSHPNLHYLRHSTVYEYGDVAFGAFSILDSSDKWPRKINSKCSTKIALFHGPINGAVTDYGYSFDNVNVNVDLFSEYDIVMLGDIHKHQFITPHIAYPGSLIQQNFGEGIEHGIIVWDVPTRTGEFVKIQQEHLFITIDDISGDIPNYDVSNLSVRIRHHNEDPKRVKEFIDGLSKKYSVSVVSIENVGAISTSELLHTLTSKHQDEDSILREYLEINGISETQTNALIELHGRIKSMRSISEDVRNVSWDIEYFAFDNMFSYGEGNVINFDKLHGLIGLFAPNATGKSTLIDAILFCVYDKCSKTNLAKNVMNVNSDYFKSELIIRIAGDRYKIIRNGVKSKLGNVSVDVSFYKIDNDGNIIENLTGSKRDVTNKIIRSYVGTYDDVTLTTISTQKNASTFSDKTQKDRQMLLYRFLDTEVYSEYEKLAKEELRTIELESFKLKKDYKNEIESKLSYITSLKDNLATKCASRDEALNRISELTSECDVKSSAIQQVEGLDIDKINAEIEHYIERVDTTERNLNTIMMDKERLTERYQSLIIERESIDINSVEIGIRQYDFLMRELNDLNLKKRKLDTELVNCRKSEIALRNHKYDPNCKYCIDNELVKRAMHDIERIGQIETELIKLNSEIDEGNKLIDLVKHNIEFRDRYKQLGHDISMVELNAKNLQSNEDNLNTQLTTYKAALVEAQLKRKRYEDSQEVILRNSEIRREIDNLRNKIVNQQMYVNELSVQIGSIENGIAQTDTIINQLKSDERRYTELESVKAITQEYITLCNRDGVPYFIIKKYLPIIERNVNDILNDIVPFMIKFNIGENETIDVYIKYTDDSEWPIEMISGMEQFISSLAIRTALLNITTLPKSAFIIIDEGFGVLDSEHWGPVNQLFMKMQSFCRFILCVSHIDSIKGMVTDVLTIDRDAGGSRIALE